MKRWFTRRTVIIGATTVVALALAASIAITTFMSWAA
jgi:hypothetical protein